MSKKILLIDTLHSSFAKILSEHNFECIEGYHLSESEVLAQIKEYAGIAIRSRFKITKTFLEKASHLQFIARAGAGMENIDVDAANKFNIVCINAPEGNRDAVGEHAIGMLLALMNHLIRADAEVRNGLWKREENRGVELQGKTIGIIGFGNMGSSFAKKLQGFDVDILAYDKYIHIDQQKFPFVKQVSLAEIHQHSDVLSLHVPLTAETNYLVNDHFLNAFTKSIWLINTARGKVLETASLVKALQSGKVIAAALDVLEYENISFEDVDVSKLPAPFQFLIQSKQVLLSPHIGGWTQESNVKIATVLAEKIIAHFNNKLK